MVAGFKFFLSNEVKIMIKKVFYSGNSSTTPSSKEDSIIINFDIFVVPYDRVFYIWLSIILHILKLKPVLQCSYVKEWYYSLMLISLLLQKHLERKEKPTKCEVASLGITVHAEFSFSLKRLIQVHFKALFTKEKSIMFRSPFSRTPIIVFVFILAILLSQIKLKVILFN